MGGGLRASSMVSIEHAGVWKEMKPFLSGDIAASSVLFSSRSVFHARLMPGQTDMEHSQSEPRDS
jgi:hypothetical protein